MTTFVAVVQNLETVAVDIGWQLAQYSATSSRPAATADLPKVPLMLVSPQCQVGFRMLRAAYEADKKALIHYVEVCRASPFPLLTLFWIILLLLCRCVGSVR